jgi:protein-S-isoprenylcysteine O-methyltransferase Ste14
MLILIVTLVAEILTIILVISGIAFPDRSVWPPNSQMTWERYVMPLLFNLSAVGVILLGLIDWGNFILPAWVRIGIGAPLWLAGNLVALWSISRLGFAPTYGAASKLVVSGPYRFSRNPQYLGFIAALIGWSLMANSIYAIISSTVGIVPLLLAPLAEESWLTSTFGPEYEQYKRKVPRFLALKKLAAFLPGRK